MATAAEVVDAFLAAIEAKDVDAAVALLADDVSYENVPIRPIVGPEAVKAALAGFLGAARRVEWKVLRQVASGDVVVNERLDRFELAGGWLELPVAGFFEVDAAAGRIRLWRDYFDLATYTNQLSALGQAPS